jgi:hypothetical protein
MMAKLTSHYPIGHIPLLLLYFIEKKMRSLFTFCSRTNEIIQFTSKYYKKKKIATSDLLNKPFSIL